MAENYQDNSMVIDGIDFSLPYDEYRENFRKKNPRAQPMSRYNYELLQKNALIDAKAREEAQKKREAAIEAGTAEGAWASQKGPSDEIVEKITGKADPTHEEVMAKLQEIAEQSSTSKQQGIQANGNQGDDHVNNPEKLDTAEITKLQNEREKLYGQKDSYTPEENEAAKNEAGITKEVPGSTSANNALTDSVAEVTTPNENDTPEEGNSKNQYNKSMMSIWDAYRAGEISKETAGYFTIDAIATLAKNLGRSIGNVAAQFSGGTIDNGHDESKWGQRQNALLNETIGKDTESLGGAAGRKAESENIANLEARIRAKYTPKMLDLEIENLEKEIKKSEIDITKAENSMAIIEHIKKDPDYAKSTVKMLFVALLSQTGVGGAVNTGAGALEKLASLRGK